MILRYYQCNINPPHFQWPKCYRIKKGIGAGETAQQLSTLTAPPDNMCAIPHTHMTAQTSATSVPGNWLLCSLLQAPSTNMAHRYAVKQKHSQTKSNK